MDTKKSQTGLVMACPQICYTPNLQFLEEHYIITYGSGSKPCTPGEHKK